jgi:hypothetical protein
MKKLLVILSLVFTSNLFGQGFTYSYVDPCSKETKVLNVTSNQLITVNYLGNISSFSQSDFLNGNFDNWINQIQSQAANQPCDELLTNTQSSQNMFITQNLISTLTSITASSTMTASNAVVNSVGNSNSGNGNSRRGNNSSNNQQNMNSNGTTNNSQGNSSNNTSSQNGGTNQGTNQSSSSTNGTGNNQEGGTTNQSNNVPQGGSGTPQQSVNPSSQGSTPSSSNTGQNSGGNTQSGTNTTQGQSQGQNVPDGSTKQNESSGGGTGGTTNSVSNAASSSGGKSGGRANVGSVIGTGDIVAIRVNENKSNQLRGTMSITKTNTNNTKAKGMLLNFTSTVNNTNLTLYGAFNNGKRTNTLIVANSSMIDFDRNFFNTTTLLDSKKFGKTALMGGLNFTVGGLAGEMFTNLSAVGGGFHPFKINNKISGNILVLGVYSPFTKFYEGKWWDSGLLIVPFSSWDYTISKNFKYNVSLSGTYELKGSVLQFQVLTGGKILL